MKNTITVGIIFCLMLLANCVFGQVKTDRFGNNVNISKDGGATFITVWNENKKIYTDPNYPEGYYDLVLNTSNFGYQWDKLDTSNVKIFISNFVSYLKETFEDSSLDFEIVYVSKDFKGVCLRQVYKGTPVGLGGNEIHFYIREDGMLSSIYGYIDTNVNLESVTPVINFAEAKEIAKTDYMQTLDSLNLPVGLFDWIFECNVNDKCYINIDPQNNYHLTFFIYCSNCGKTCAPVDWELTINYWIDAITGKIYNRSGICPSGIISSAELSIPTKLEYQLDPPYPNPFNPSTNITFSVPRIGNVIIKVYDLLGREVATLMNEVTTAGYHTVKFNASNLPSGMYIVRMQAEGTNLIQKMILSK